MTDGTRRAGTEGSQTSAMQSPLAWALLGLVIEQPSYGYELAQRFRRVYGEALGLSYRTNIYRPLEILHKHALIEEAPADEEAPAPNRLPKPHYRATEQGVRAYEHWLLAQLEEERHRQRLFARQLAMLEPHMALQVIDRYEEECLADADDPAPAESEREGVAARLADEEEHLAIEARLSWIRYARHELAALIEERPRGAEAE
ncbi:MAG: PadR family transcriptional regulator [Solirubrobacterales bacterium]|nr:PadR family transcriptional regulator [Solirubrobacterales bacterium]